MKKKILTVVFIIVAIIVLFLVRTKFSDYNLKKTVQACIVAQKQTSKSFNKEQATKHCNEKIKKKLQNN